VLDRPEESRDDGEREGKYTNFFTVGFNSVEFVLDFGQAYDDSARELRHTRIVTTPAYAQALAELLIQSLTAYEQAHGRIPRLSARGLTPDS
jgi:hypothetical protein